MTAPPPFLTNRPNSGAGMDADTLSDVLRGVRLKGAIFFDVETAAPWVAEAPPAKLVAPTIMPGSGHVIEYHVITSGSCWASIVGDKQEPVALSAGDVVAFPQGDAHVLSSAPGMRGNVEMSLFQAPEGAPELPLLLNMDGGGKERAHVVCGFLGCDTAPFNPLLDALPRIMRLSHAVSGRSEWLAQFSRFAVMETKEKRQGGNGILSRLGEIMFAELVRNHVETLPEHAKGWLGGLKDRHVGRVLNLLHKEPARNWTLEGLAKDVGISRSALAERFTAYVGVPPMKYLQKWRLQLAASNLLEGTANIASIAEEAGYESEAAFSRAFKKATGMPPAEWRNHRASHVAIGT
jgi:AraC-like DNA-binding protein